MKKFLFLTLLLSAIGLQGWAEQYPDTLYAVGSATSTGWNLGAANKLYKYANSNTYQGFVSFSASDGELKFLCQTDFGDMWGAPSEGVAVSEAGTTSISYHGGGNPDNKFKPTFDTGLYLVTIDATTEGSETVTFKKWDNSTDVYEIGNAAQLSAFANCVNSNFSTTIKGQLTANIDMNGVDYPGIGTSSHPFAGTLKGDGAKIISNLTMDKDDDNVGLIGVATAGADVEDITLDFTCSFKGNSNVAAFIGKLDGEGTVTITKCGNEATVEATTAYAAGLVGYANSTIPTFTNCYNVGIIKASTGGDTGYGTAAGLSVHTPNAVFHNCYNYLDADKCWGLLTGEHFAIGADMNITDNNWDYVTTWVGLHQFSPSEMADGTLKTNLGDAYTNMVYGTKAHPGFATQKYIELREDAVNTLPNENMTSMNVKLYRTLVGDTWNSICLPFDLDADGVISVFGENTKLAEFTGVNGANNDNLHFDLVTSISAKKPYLIYPHDNRDINTPIVLSGITIQVNPETVNYDPFNFIGIYTPTAIDGKYFIASSNTIKKSNGGNLKGFRAYIEDITPSSSRTLTFDCDDIQVTEISTIANSQKLNANRLIYDLQGRKVMNPTKGMYIVNGKKVVVK